MQYLLLIYQGSSPTPRDPDAWATLSQAEQQQVYADYQAVNETAGVTPGLALDVPGQAKTVQLVGGSTVVTDGPFVETREAIAGYLVLDAPDEAAAIALAAKIPAARLGGAIEVRSVVQW
jgi:hypothetical protein